MTFDKDTIRTWGEIASEEFWADLVALWPREFVSFQERLKFHLLPLLKGRKQIRTARIRGCPLEALRIKEMMVLPSDGTEGRESA